MSPDEILELGFPKVCLHLWISVVVASWTLDRGEAACLISPPTVIDGSYSPILESYPDYMTVTYACDMGFVKTSGDLILTCSINRSWVGTAPICEAQEIPCTQNEFRCSKGILGLQQHKCIPRNSMCNGRRDCTDNEDEQCAMNCENELSFHCDNKSSECVPCWVMCDGRRNCQNGYDEDGCDTEIMDLCLRETGSGIGILDKKTCFAFMTKTRCSVLHGEELSVGSESTNNKLVLYLDISKDYSSFEYVLGLSVKTGTLTHADYVWNNGSPLTYTNWTFPTPSLVDMCICLFKYEKEWKVCECGFESPLQVCVFTSIDKQTNMLLGAPVEGMPVDPYMHYECNSGELISIIYVCDAVQDCFDNSDEIHCGKDSSIVMQTCNDGRQINQGLWCDFYPDCQDRSDETDCAAIDCDTYEWRCDNGQCVTFDLLCDNKLDCYDGSDESRNACSGDCELRELYSCGDFFKKCITMSLAADAVYECCNDDSCDEPPPVEQIITSCNQQGSMDNAYINVGEDLHGTLNGACHDEKTYVLNTGFTQQYDKRRNVTQVVFLLGSKYLVDRLLSVSKECKISRHFSYIIPGDTSSSKIFQDDIVSSDSFDPLLELNGEYVITDSAECLITCDPPYTVKDEPTMACKTGKTKMFARHKCLLNIKPDGAPYGCRDLTHLDNCEDFSCPPHYVKCPGSFCLHIRLVCDGQPHCPQSEDEIDCEKYVCKGMVSCRESGSCLSHDLVCDGIRQCPQGDDERLCGFKCPQQCECNGAAFIKCSVTLPFVNATKTAKHVRYLDLSNNEIMLSPLDSELALFQSLIVLNISRCGLKYIMSNLTTNPLQFLKNLRILDLSHNKLERLKGNDFSGLSVLKKLILTGNTNLVTVEPNGFIDLKKVTHLYMAYCGITTMNTSTFRGMNSLKYLDLNSNPLYIPTGTFVELSSLSYLDIHGATVELESELLAGIDNLQTLYTDSFSLCCEMKKKYLLSLCFAPVNTISSCENLLQNDLLRLSIWVIGLSAVLGNIFVIGYHVRLGVYIQKWHSYTVYVTSLGVSDLYMGIYTLIIASVDVYFRGTYSTNDIKWRDSLLCKFAGMLATVSCEASAMLICLLVVDRYVAIRYPTSTFTPKQALICAVLSQIIAVVIAVIPFTADSYFGGEFYSSSSVGIALPLTGIRTKGWQYSVCIFIVFNMILFVIVGLVQVLLYKAVKASNKNPNKKQGEADAAVARSLFGVILTNFCCWFPICVLGFMSLGGYELSLDLYVWIIISVVPLNAALNPFLYTVSSIRKKMKSDYETVESDAVTTNAFLQIFNDITMDGRLTHVPANNQSSMPLSQFLTSNILSTQDVNLIKRQLLGDIEKFHAKHICHGYISEDTVSIVIDEKDIVDVHLEFRHKEITAKMDRRKDVADVDAVLVRLRRSFVNDDKF